MTKRRTTYQASFFEKCDGPMQPGMVYPLGMQLVYQISMQPGMIYPVAMQPGMIDPVAMQPGMIDPVAMQQGLVYPVKQEMWMAVLPM